MSGTKASIGEAIDRILSENEDRDSRTAERKRFNGLKRQASKATRSRGHRLRWTSTVETFARIMSFGVCRDCQMSVTVNSHPAPNDIHVGGDAIALTCLGKRTICGQTHTDDSGSYRCTLPAGHEGTTHQQTTHPMLPTWQTVTIGELTPNLARTAYVLQWQTVNMSAPAFDYFRTDADAQTSADMFAPSVRWSIRTVQLTDWQWSQTFGANRL